MRRTQSRLDLTHDDRDVVILAATASPLPKVFCRKCGETYADLPHMCIREMSPAEAVIDKITVELTLKEAQSLLTCVIQGLAAIEGGPEVREDLLGAQTGVQAAHRAVRKLCDAITYPNGNEHAINVFSK